MASYSSPADDMKACHNPNCTSQGCRKRCSGCNGLRVCGKDCQAALWNSHKAFCKAISKAPDATCLLLDGMGILGPDAFYAQNVKAALESAGVKVATVDLSRGSGVWEQVGSVLFETRRRFTSCIILGLGGGNTDLADGFGASEDFRKKIVSWVGDQGGRLITQGERTIGGWPEWFGKTWKFDDYRRTDHECHAKSDDDVHWCKWYSRAEGAITRSINVKAVMMRDVPPKESLFGTTGSSVSYSNVFFMAGMAVEGGLSAVAFGKYGEGSVSSFGDVNAEVDTCAIMAIIARGY